ncbi:hypothetical protein ACLOJK_030278 [Asimina triloba]
MCSFFPANPTTPGAIQLRPAASAAVPPGLKNRATPSKGKKERKKLFSFSQLQALDHLKAIFATLSIISSSVALLTNGFFSIPVCIFSGLCFSVSSNIMDADSFSSSISSSSKIQSRRPLQEHAIQRHHLPKQNYVADRFIPVRSAMDFDMAHYLLTESRKDKENEAAAASPSKEAYRKQLAETLMMNRTRILAFKSKPPAAADGIFQEFYADSVPSHQLKPSKPRRYIPQSAERTLDAPEIVDDYYLNLLDWGSGNVVAIALGSTVYLWDASSGSTSELVTVDEDNGPVTSVSWAPDGRHLAVGLNSSLVQLWDTTANRHLRTLRGGHRNRVGSLAWNNSILTTGGMDGQIINNDVRIRSHIVETYRGHQQEVCGLKWSGSGQQLASGGNDNLLYIWDRGASASSSTQWLHRFEDHIAAVKGLAWCPFQSNLLASGGGAGDRCIKFWNTHTGACLNSIDTGSQVCSLLWSKKERELLSSHGFTQNQLTLWKYPSMVKMAELTGHTSRVLFMAQSPDGCTVASAAGDETLRFWNVFGTPEVAKPKAPATREAVAGQNVVKYASQLSELLGCVDELKDLQITETTQLKQMHKAEVRQFGVLLGCVDELKDLQITETTQLKQMHKAEVRQFEGCNMSPE